MLIGDPALIGIADIDRVLDIAEQRVTYDAFIRQEYSELVKENTRFWNTSGIDISAGLDENLDRLERTAAGGRRR